MKTIGEPLANASDMFAVHTMFRREVGLMSGLVRAAMVNDEERTALVADHVALVSTILGIHHSGEDHYIWPLLRERGTEKMTSILGVMEKQHEGIHQSLALVAKAIDSWREGASAEARDSLADLRRSAPVAPGNVSMHPVEPEPRGLPEVFGDPTVASGYPDATAGEMTLLRSGLRLL